MNGSRMSPPYCHDPIVEVDRVSFAYENKPVLENLSLRILQRDFVGLIGSNGAGKTTLLRMLVGLLKPDQGEIRLFGQPLSQFKDWERIGYVPQKNALNPLFPSTVREVVLSGTFGRKNISRRSGQTELKRCQEALEALGIEDLAERKIGRLSGGQQQRVFLARSLVNQPNLLILDEPTVGVDAETLDSFFRLILHLHQHHNMTFIIVSHDIDLLRGYLGNKQSHTNGRLQFFVRHAHEMDCDQTDLTHPLRELHDPVEQPIV